MVRSMVDMSTRLDWCRVLELLYDSRMKVRVPVYCRTCMYIHEYLNMWRTYLATVTPLCYCYVIQWISVHFQKKNFNALQDWDLHLPGFLLLGYFRSLFEKKLTYCQFITPDSLFWTKSADNSIHLSTMFHSLLSQVAILCFQHNC